MFEYVRFGPTLPFAFCSTSPEINGVHLNQIPIDHPRTSDLGGGVPTLSWSLSAQSSRPEVFRLVTPMGLRHFRRNSCRLCLQTPHVFITCSVYHKKRHTKRVSERSKGGVSETC